MFERAGSVGTPPQHYGNPLSEQKAILSGALVELASSVITLTGPDRLSWLDSLTSQSLKALQPGESAETLLLDPSGRLEHAIHVVDDGNVSYLIASDGPGLYAFLSRMVFMLRVEVVLTDLRVVGSFASLDALATWVDPWEAGPGHTYAESRPDAPWSYREHVVAPDFSWHGPVAGTLALEALRIAAWRPAQQDADDRTIPHELDWLRSAVHLTKGCYRGQETIAKVHNLGHPPRRVVLLHLDGTVPAAGSAVLAGDVQVGAVTSSALHWELGPIALAVIKRSVDPTVDLVVQTDDGPIAAAQEVIVPTDAGATANVPRLPRLGAVRR
ncbi:MAG: folate-binding protein YgfZ [Leifsonia sp.]|nr:folate-binding protein YgfZ [Leifsonia sp.]